MGFFAVIGKFVSEFARFILFFASIIFLLGSSLLLLASSHARNDLSPMQIDGIRTVLSIAVGFSIYLILLAIIGIFASFFSSTGTIKLLAMMTVLNIGIGLAVLATSTPRIELVREDLRTNLAKFQVLYDWDHNKDSSKERKDATAIWDTIQTNLDCCGLKSPTDWDAFRPKDLPSRTLPGSCCKKVESTKDGLCDSNKSEAWSNSCSDNLEDAFTMIMDMVVFMIVFNVIVGVLACLVLCCNPYSSHSYGESAHY